MSISTIHDVQLRKAQMIQQLILSALVASSSSSTPEKAMTVSGREVLLYPNGTWKESTKVRDVSVIRPTMAKFTVSPTAKAEVALFKDQAVLKYDPSSWKVSTRPSDPNQFKFIHKSGECHALIILERFPSTIASFKNIALTNAKEVASNLVLSKEEIHNVNGCEVLQLEFNCTVSNVPLTYLNYYYPSSNLSIQMVTFTSSMIYSEYKTEMQNFLTGLMVLN